MFFPVVDISVIVPTYNSSKGLAQCLEALSSQSVPRENYEVIVVDDGSLDDTASVAGSFEVQVVRQDHAGPAAARNCGAKHARGDILLFTDSDCAPQNDWIEQMGKGFQSPEVIAVKGVYRTRQRGFVPRFAQAEFEEKYARMGKAAYIDFVDTYSAGYRRRVFLDNGGFDTSFPGPSAEDVELSFRLSQKGYKMAFVPQAIVYHSHPSSLWRYLSRKFHFGFWRAKVYLRFPGKLAKDSYTPRSIPFQIFFSSLLTASLVVGIFRPAALQVALLLGVAFLLSVGPFVARTFWRDKAVALASPLLLFLRSLAQVSGLLVGTLVFLAPSRRSA